MANPVDVVIRGQLYYGEVGGGPMPPGPGEPPLSIWGGGNVPYPQPPIYIEVPPPEGGPPIHIWIPVFPTNPIVLPLPPDSSGEPRPPVVYPPLPGGVPPVGGYPGFPAPQPPLGIWGPNDPRPQPPIYIAEPGDPPHVWIPVFPTNPIVLPGDGEKPKPPPDMISPPTGAPGFWGYSMYYDSYVFVPYAGAGPEVPGGRR